jgi:glycosyltransferase involved in cell wall biosynthesis
MKTMDQTISSMKVVLVSNMLPPYRVSFYRALSRRLNFGLLLDTMSEFNRQWKLPEEAHELSITIQNCRSFVYSRLRSDVGYEEKRQFQFSEQTLPILREMRPDVVISIEFGLKTLWSLLYGWIYGVPVILLSEGTLHTEGHVGGIKRWLRRLIVSQCARYWSNGPDATALLVSYGADPKRVDEGMTGIDTSDWRANVERAMSEREAVRSKWGLRGRVLLFSGTLTPRKGVMPLLRAMEQWVEEDGGAEVSLLLLGSGEEQSQVEEWCANHPGVRVVMPGFVQPSELAPFFAAADWAVLPTLDDNWPLATLETLVAGLPQLFSVYNGATSDLCREGTGLVFDPLDQDDFVRALRAMAAAPEGRIAPELVQQIAEYYGAEGQATRAMASLERLEKI